MGQWHDKLTGWRRDLLAPAAFDFLYAMHCAGRPLTVKEIHQIRGGSLAFVRRKLQLLCGDSLVMKAKTRAPGANHNVNYWSVSPKGNQLLVATQKHFCRPLSTDRLSPES